MRECNCCMKNVRNLTKCFVNNQCSWRSCNNCINKQITYEDGNKFLYKCPYCRRDSEYHMHSRFCKYVKSNRGALRKINQLQSDYIKKLTHKLVQVHLLVSLDSMTVVTNFVNQPLPPPEPEPIDHENDPHYEFT